MNHTEQIMEGFSEDLSDLLLNKYKDADQSIIASILISELAYFVLKMQEWNDDRVLEFVLTALLESLTELRSKNNLQE